MGGQGGLLLSQEVDKGGLGLGVVVQGAASEVGLPLELLGGPPVEARDVEPVELGVRRHLGQGRVVVRGQKYGLDAVLGRHGQHRLPHVDRQRLALALLAVFLLGVAAVAAADVQGEERPLQRAEPGLLTPPPAQRRRLMRAGRTFAPLEQRCPLWQANRQVEAVSWQLGWGTFFALSTSR